MAHVPVPEPDEQVAALKKKIDVTYDLMRPGPGTPWENRGRAGILGSFLKTCWRSLYSPRALLRSIHRLESESDAKGFALGCGILWALGWVISGAVYFVWKSHDPTLEPDAQVFYIGSALQLIVTPFIVLYSVKFAAGLYYKLVSGEMRSRFNPELALNCFGYSMGPAILALIPIAGPPLALLWTLMVVIIAGASRLKVKLTTAIICGIICVLTPVVVFIAAYFLVFLAWRLITNGGGLPGRETPLPRPAGEIAQ